jgi:hypothetical protein
MKAREVHDENVKRIQAQNQEKEEEKKSSQNLM